MECNIEVGREMILANSHRIDVYFTGPNDQRFGSSLLIPSNVDRPKEIADCFRTLAYEIERHDRDFQEVLDEQAT